ncbi:hypothetical protein AB3331_05510 [Streptococcus sp. H49]|uniref:hypothetical protein n=1 Tax=Streptococcus huangxiaojuni TaxID=3237239 RepID=UPI0034A2B1D9
MLYLTVFLVSLALLVAIGVPYLIDLFKVMETFKKSEGESLHNQLFDMFGFHRHSHS